MLRPPSGLRRRIRATAGVACAAAMVAGGSAAVRPAPRTPDGGVLADYHGALDDPAHWAERFGATPGVVEHGLFPPSMVSLVVVGRGDEVESFGPAG